MSRSVTKMFGTVESYSLISWVFWDPGLIPNTLDANLKKWQAQGLNIYLDLFERNTLKSFQNLRDQYGLASQDLFRSLQLRHHVNKLISKEDMLKSLSGTGILSVFISAYRADQGHKTISKLYKGLQELSGANTSYVKEKWESEGNFVLSIEEWDNLIERQWKSTNSRTWREFSWKHLVRYFLTPVQSRRGQMVCWRGCGSVRANHHHVFWECPGMVHYWDSIRDGMERVLQM